MLRRPASLTLAVLLAAALAGCSDGVVDDTVSPVAVAESVESTVTDPEREAVREQLALVPAAAAPSAQPSTTPTTPATPAAPSFDVAAVQRQLTEQRYYVGAVDGKAGPTLKSAVMAFQKVNGLGVDGGVGPATLAALAAPTAPVLKGSSPSNRVEVDLTKQVLYVVKGGAIDRIMPVSSGNGASYTQKDGSTARSLSPVGHYTIQRRIVGERNADLGTLYDPQYFYKGWAIHGSNSVPAGPASHGCIRVTRPDAKWLLNEINNGMSVFLYGGTHTFTAGSSAPGTETPTGDGASAATAEQPSPAPAPVQPAPQQPAQPAPAPQQPAPEQPTPSETADPSPSPTPAETGEPSPSP